MIHKLVLQNFKGIESAELTFERLTVLVGPNASGKTSVLQALALLAEMADAGAQREDVIARYGGLSVIRQSSRGTAILSIQADDVSAQGSGSLKFELKAHGRQKGLEKQDPTTTVLSKWGDKTFELPKAPRPSPYRPFVVSIPKSEPEPEIQVFLERMNSSTLLRLEAEQLANPSYAVSANPRLDTNGSGLASVLAQMALNKPDDFAGLLRAVRAVIPQIERVRLSLAMINDSDDPKKTHSGHRILFDLVGASDIPSEAASEGTMLVLGLLTVLFSTPKPKLLLLDDLDRGLHPRAQRDLVAQLRKLLEQDPELQIIATSHSPYLLDNLDPKEVRLSNVLPDGTIRFAALTDHPDFERWKGVMHPGEFWSTVGEQWVGEPRKEQTDG